MCLSLHARRLAGRAAAGLTLLASGALTPALAQTPSPMPEWEFSAGELLRVVMEPELPTWSSFVGVSTEYLPRFDGAREYHVLSAPTFDIRYRDVAFLSTGEGLGVNLLHSKTYRAGFAISYDLGRPESASGSLRGLGDIHPSAELKSFAEYLIFPVMLRADLRRTLGAPGLIGDLSVYLPVVGSDRFFVLVGPSLTFADAAYMQRYFGIDGSQSANSGYAVFAPSGGLKSTSFGIDATWLLTDEWMINGILAGNRLLNDAAQSPLTRQRAQYTLSLTAGYQF